MVKKGLTLLILIVLIGSLAIVLSTASDRSGDTVNVKSGSGEKLVQNLCLYCHSDAAVAKGRVAPWKTIMSGLEVDKFQRAVKEGVSPVMPAFPELSQNQISSIYTSLEKRVATSSGPLVKGEKGEISRSTLEKDLAAKLRCPCCGKVVKDCACGLIEGIRSEIHTLAMQGLGEKEIKAALAKKYGNRILPIYDIPDTLSPEPYYRIAHSYEVAKTYPDLLSEITCFCPCYQVGHASLLDCYKDDHAANCQICMDETLEAEHLQTQGVDRKEIVETIHNRHRIRGK